MWNTGDDLRRPYGVVMSARTDDQFVDRMIDKLFVAQDRRPDDLGDIDVAALPSFERGLLVIVGLVTQFIEAYKMEPVQVHQLAQQCRRLNQSDPWLDMSAGQEVTSRQVILKGAKSETAYLHGEALIVAERLPEGVRRDLHESGMGLGQILRHRRVETHGELLWCGTESGEPQTSDARPDRPTINKTYRFICDGSPIILITERFPPPQGS